MSVASRGEGDRADFLDTLPRISNEAAAPKIAAHSPSDNSKTTISDAPLFSGRAAARVDRSDRDGPEAVLILWRRAWRSAASVSRRRFRKTGFAGVTPTARR